MVLSTYQVSRKEIKKNDSDPNFLPFVPILHFLLSKLSILLFKLNQKIFGVDLVPDHHMGGFHLRKMLCFFWPKHKRDILTILLREFRIWSNLMSDQILYLIKSDIWSNLISDKIWYLIKLDFWYLSSYHLATHWCLHSHLHLHGRENGHHLKNCVTRTMFDNFLD